MLIAVVIDPKDLRDVRYAMAYELGHIVMIVDS
jgi:hypothetical protein